MGTVQIVTKLLAYLVFASQIALIAFLASFFFKKHKLVMKIRKFADKHVLCMAFAVALVSTLGSLFFSEIAGYNPCNLCWYQRIFMYPQVVILGIAIYMKRKDFAYNTLALSIIGGIISLYQNIAIIIKNAATSVCTADGASCFANFFVELKYINIPMMALTGFVILTVLSVIALRYKGKK